MYFYWGRPVTFSDFPTPRTDDPDSARTFVALEYWFYYPHNYFPCSSPRS